MKSLVIKRSIVIDGRRTSVTVEEAFWKGLHEIAHERDVGMNKLIANINRNRQFANLSSTIRLFVLSTSTISASVKRLVPSP
jgi:predicted DNA-binding ribbon-helix-helix protein